MSNRFRPALALLLLLSGCGSSSSDNIARDVEIALAAIPVEGEAEPPAMTTAVVEILSRDTPGLASHLPDIKRREKAALKRVIADYRQRETASIGPGDAVLFEPRYANLTLYNPISARGFGLLDLIAPPAHAMSETPPASGEGDVVATLAGNVATEIFGALGDGEKAGKAERHSIEYKGEGGETASLDVSVDENGQITGSIASNAAIPPLGMEANSKVTLVATTLCPDASGRVAFTVKLSQGGGAGGGAYSRNLEARVEATVNDNASISDAQIDTKYDERSTTGDVTSTMSGETAWSVPNGATASAQAEASTITKQSGDGAKVREMTDGGMRHSLMLAYGALQAAERHWQGGHCIRIQATSPGKVSPGQRSDIPVSVTSRQDAAEITAKVTATLTGGKSVDPTEISKSPGRITHTAPDERTKQMSIKLVAVSRCGKAEETLTISMSEGQYRAEGGAGEFHGVGLICDLAQPFTISGSGVTVNFTPLSEDAGSYSYSGAMSGFAVQGTGTYTVGYTDYGETASAIYATGPGSVTTPMGTVSGTDSEEYALTKITDDSCDS